MVTEPVQFYVREEVKEWLRQYAERHGLTMSTVLRIMVERERTHDQGRKSANGTPLYATRTT